MPNIQKDIEENKDDKSDALYDYNSNILYNNIKEERSFLSDNDINIKEFFNQNDSGNLSEGSIKNNKITKNEEKYIKEDLKFLGNSNKLDWNLISEEDKLKGKEIWKKLTNKKKDIGINCNLNNSEIKKKELNTANTVKIIIPKIKSNIKENIKIKKRITFSSERIKKFKKEPRKTIILTPKIKLEPIKVNNNPSFIKSNSIFKVSTRFFINEKKFDNINDDIISKKKEKTKNDIFSSYKGKPKLKIPKVNTHFSDKKKLNKKKLNKKINFSNPKKTKIKKKIEADTNSESDLDIINEETKSIKSIKVNSNDDENELDDLDYDNNEENVINNDNKEKINTIKNYSKPEIKKEIEEKDDKNSINDKPEEELNEKQIMEEDDNNNNEENEKEISDNESNEINEKENIKKEEESLNESQNSKNEEDLKNIHYMKMKEMKKKYEAEKYNKELMLRKLKGKKKKTKLVRQSIYDFLKDLKNKKINTGKEKYIHKPHIRKYFKDIDISSISEINKRKIELLFRIKHDLEYKIKIGDIISMSNLTFRDLEQKIYSTKIKSYDQKGINEYLDEIEYFFSSFENDMDNAINLKKDQDRINRFRNNLIDNVNFYEILRGKKQKIYANSVDFNIINHINELSLLEQEQKE